MGARNFIQCLALLFAKTVVLYVFEQLKRLDRALYRVVGKYGDDWHV